MSQRSRVHDLCVGMTCHRLFMTRYMVVLQQPCAPTHIWCQRCESKPDHGFHFHRTSPVASLVHVQRLIIQYLMIILQLTAVSSFVLRAS